MGAERAGRDHPVLHLRGSMPAYQNILSNRYTLARSWTLDAAEKAGAYVQARRALTQLEPDFLKNEVKAANIRGQPVYGAVVSPASL